MQLLSATLIYYIYLLMVLCGLCGLGDFAAGRGLAIHLKKCRGIQAMHSQAVQHAAELEIAAAAAPTPEPEPIIPDRSPSPVIESPPSPPPPGPGGRPRRHRRLPKRFQDDPPAPPTPVEPLETPAVEDIPPVEPTAPPISRKWLKTDPNQHGLYKIFPNCPTHDPDESISLDDLCQSSELLVPTKITPASTPAWFPFANVTIARLMTWFHLGSNLKSIAELDSLVENVLLQDDFDRVHLQDFSAARENKRLDDTTPAASDAPDGWKTASVKIKLPAPKVSVAEKDAAEFEVEGLIYRPLLDVMIEAFQSPAFAEFHITPFEQRWDPHHNPTDNDVRLEPADVDLDENGLPVLPDGHQVVYSEIYTSSKMFKEHSSLPQTAEPRLETIIAAYMFWSDSTHLANFGNASLWPLYTFFGNQSKYTRAKPTSNAGHHQAYFPSLPASVKDFYREKFGVAPTADMMAHLKRELMHAIWDLLLCPEFIHAYIHGIVVKCFDGIERRIFPRIFTYGADYPEKVLLATIKYFGGCPCPRCLVEKSQIPEMGTKADMRRRKNIREDTSWYRFIIELVRRWIFERGCLVGGAAVARNLKARSWVPTRNAFSKLAEYGFNFFSMFVPDLLHEVELGGWKSPFVHLIRILYEHNPISVEKLDERFRRVPTFGRCTIRRFHANVSEMKKLAARDFEDILQCCIPVIEGLLPEPHNTIVLTLLYTFATWHAYAKLRLHSDSSIQSFRAVTTELGAKARHFIRTTCEAYTTYELPQEQARRARRQAQKDSKSNKNPSAATSSKKRKVWNICTYKWHAMGDYPDTILDFGTTDSYSTQIGELSHRLAKRYYAKTNKRQFERQIANHELRQRVIRAMKQRMDDEAAAKADPSPPDDGPSANPPNPILPPSETPSSASTNIFTPDNDNLSRTPPRQHHHISESKKTHIHAHQFIARHRHDPALKNFIPDLKSHLLGRLLNIPYDGDETQFTPQDLSDVNIERERLYTHQILRVNYTTYDARRDQDTLNTRTHPDFMVLAHEDEDEASSHQYWYGRILGIFHANVRHIGSRSTTNGVTQKMEFLWVRWFGRDMSHSAGWKHKRLHRLGFVDATVPDSGAIGFLDPAEIIRGAHLIPAFHYGRTPELLAPSIARHFDSENDEDYLFYYVNSFVDRDMFMRYSSDAVGHRVGRKSASGLTVDPVEDDEMDVDAPLPESLPEHIDEAPDLDGDEDDEIGSDLESVDLNDSDDEGEDGLEKETEEVIEETDDAMIESAGYGNL